MTRPFVSVLIDTYNHEQFIEQAVQSVVDQEFPAADREILVVDDGSTDGTRAILHKFEPHVRVLDKSNGGQASAFNVGIPECRGEIIAFLDGDDWWAPDKLHRVVEIMAADDALVLVGHGIVESLEGGTERTVALEKPERLRLSSLATARVFRLWKSFLGTSRMTLRANIARQIVPVPEALKIEADEYLFTIAAALGDLVILQEALCYYRLHSGNLYVGAGSNANSLRRKQLVQAALVGALRRELPARGVPEDAVDCVTEIIAAEAEQIRLMLDGGAPWKTVQTENKIYKVLHRDAPWSHKVFRHVTMLVALLLPPRWFYEVRRRASLQSWYSGLRRKVLPVPRITNVAGQEGVQVSLLKKRLVNFWNSQQVYWDPISAVKGASSPQREKAASFLSDGSRVLDVACGSAANAYWLARRCAYFGSDISQTGLRRATDSTLRLVCGDVDQLPFASEAFEGAISTFALEHCVNPVQMLREMRRVVRPGGRIILLGPSWDLPFWYPNAVQSKAQEPGWRVAYTLRRFLGQLGGWLFGRLPFLRIEDPDAFHREFVHDADAVYVVWSYEVIRQMKRFGCRLIHAEVDNRMWGTKALVRLLKRLLFLLPPYRHAGSTVLLVFER